MSETSVENKSISSSQTRDEESPYLFRFITIFCNFFLLANKILREMQFEKLWRDKTEWHRNSSFIEDESSWES